MTVSKQPDRVTVDESAYDQLSHIKASTKVPKHRIIGHCIEFAVQNSDEFQQYMEEQ
ncbi:hypothetical protein NP511_17850 [Natrinema thermotolerans]|uniref:Uncharacterized protein n=1 Tax=Natrinema thermotolerans TaxID=121872 RepID=A0AAF0PD33_9EURY|nr:hypothetical protein [Natrinema thermotolerans]WMT07239.1 hypothetical protein NP511_17850 [Natrinema thermotolerans]